MRPLNQVQFDVETRAVAGNIGGLAFSFSREVRRVRASNDLAHDLPVDDLVPDVELFLDDLIPARRSQIATDVRSLYCPRRMCVYAIADGEATLYVGVTGGGVNNRLTEHKTAKTPLGLFLDGNPEEAKGFVIEQYFMPDRKTALWYEAEMIRSRKPSLNVVHNGGGSL